MFNIDETGIMLSDLDTIKVLIARSDKEQRRSRVLKRTIITTIEYVSTDSFFLLPLIIFLGKVLYSI